MQCPECSTEEFSHIHDAAHGLAGTHMGGSERFVCDKCSHSIYKHDGEPLGFNYILD